MDCVDRSLRSLPASEPPNPLQLSLRRLVSSFTSSMRRMSSARDKIFALEKNWRTNVMLHSYDAIEFSNYAMFSLLCFLHWEYQYVKSGPKQYYKSLNPRISRIFNKKLPISTFFFHILWNTSPDFLPNRIFSWRFESLRVNCNE